MREEHQYILVYEKCRPRQRAVCFSTSGLWLQLVFAATDFRTVLTLHKFLSRLVIILQSLKIRRNGHNKIRWKMGHSSLWVLTCTHGCWPLILWLPKYRNIYMYQEWVSRWVRYLWGAGKVERGKAEVEMCRLGTRRRMGLAVGPQFHTLSSCFIEIKSLKIANII